MGLFDWLKGKPAARPADRGWNVGDRVLAKWDDFFYPGKVKALGDGKCQVLFDDGDTAWVPAGLVVAPDIGVGSRVFARIKAGPVYLPGVVREQRGEKIHIEYDHGEEEWSTISLVRVERGGGQAASSPPPVPQKHALDLGEPLTGSDWRVGDRVLARWLDFYWYPGSILGLGEKGIHVLYDDGDQRVVQESNLMPLVIEEGEHIHIRAKNQPQLIYTPATVTRVNGETLDVTLEDGEEETNTKVSRARLWRCPVGVGAMSFEEGQRVLAFGNDDCLYPAEIVSIEEDRVIVHYLFGFEGMVTPELIRKFDLRVGAKIECRWKGGPNSFPGTLSKIEGERIFVKYDDGDEEWTSVRLLRIPRRTGG